MRNDWDLYRSTDGGQTWHWLWSASSSLNFSISPDYAQDRILFVGAGPNTLLRSTDGGEHWTMYNEGPKDLSVGIVVLSPDWAYDQTLFAAGYGPTHRSIDGGASWQAVGCCFWPRQSWLFRTTAGSTETFGGDYGS